MGAGTKGMLLEVPPHTHTPSIPGFWLGRTCNTAQRGYLMTQESFFQEVREGEEGSSTMEAGPGHQMGKQEGPGLQTES